MTPVEQSPRHYQGPEQPKAPPMPTMPPAEELIEQEPGVAAEAVSWDPMEQVDIEAAFSAWAATEAQGISAQSQMIAFLAFKAGAAWQRDQMMPARPADLPLEGTVESRTIVAALQLFKEQVLVHGPEEVKSGEWLNARDVEVLIQGIRAQAAKGR